jgi:hypothetical protein
MIEFGSIETTAGMTGVLGTFALDAMEDLFALHGYALGRVDAQPNLIALDAQHCHRDLVPDHDRFTDSTRQD